MRTLATGSPTSVRLCPPYLGVGKAAQRWVGSANPAYTPHMTKRFLTFAAASVFLLAGSQSASFAQDSLAEESGQGKHAIVLVSGTAATTPFTTPSQACGSGFSAGNTWAYLRDYLVDRGYPVYTAPASVGGSKVVETKDAYAGPFGDCPEQLPASMTINAVGSVDRSGASLSRFIKYLNTEYGVTRVDVVGHSLGGVIGRAGIREVRLNELPVTVTSYTTIGSPWDGTQIASLDSQDPLKGCDGAAICEGFVSDLLRVPGIAMLIATLNPEDEPIWNQSQVGVLDGIPVTLIAGTYFTKKDGSAKRWPNDGVIERTSALATKTPNSVIPHRTCFAFPMTHSLFISQAIDLPDSKALTWNPRVGATIAQAIDNAPTALLGPNRQGCPKARR